MQLVAYILIYPILWMISLLPFRLLYMVSDFLYLFMFHLVGYRRKVVNANLNLVFPNKTQHDITVISKKFYHHLCDLMVESIKLMTISEFDLKRRYKFTNIDELKQYEDGERSIVLMCGHYANFEWIFILDRYVKFKCYAVYKRLSNKYFDTLVKRIRGRFNGYLITTKEAIPTLQNLKKLGELTINGFNADQSPKINKAYHWEKFMGIMVPVHTGAEMLAKKLDMSVVFVSVKKTKRGYYETTFETIAENPHTFKDYEITDTFLGLLEKQIYEAPEYYLWTHKRWKHKDAVPTKYR